MKRRQKAKRKKKEKKEKEKKTTVDNQKLKFQTSFLCSMELNIISATSKTI